MEKARVELGPEAMLMSSKKTGPGLTQLGAYEVVFGVSNQTPAAAQSETRNLISKTSSDDVDVARELAELRKQIDTVRRSVSQHSYTRGAAIETPPQLRELHDLLLAADFSEELAGDLVESAAARLRSIRNDALTPLAPGLAAIALKQELEQRLRFSAELGQAGSEQRVVAFVGPSGTGKTTTLVKLAMRFGVASRTPLQIFSTDTMRVGGFEQLGVYSKIMGIGFQATHTISALEQALEECRGKKLVLIDTPGYGAREMEEAVELKSFLGRNPHVEVHLVVPATLRPTSAVSVLRRFAILRPSKILFTHADEVEAPGAILESAIRSELPVSFVATGQQIPDDIEEASNALLTDKLFEPARAAALAAA